MDDREFFNKLAPTWDQNEVRSTSERINHILDLLDIREGDAILDLGTGTGVLLPYLAQRIGKNGTITAVDYSTGMIEQAEKKYQNLNPKPEFLVVDFETENISGEYDRIILYCVYPHLHQPIDTIKWLGKVNLKKNGMITVAFPSGPDFINNIHREKHSDSDILPSAHELASFFRSQGLNAEVASATDDAYVVNIKF